jgi:hypothetical protein
MCQRTRLGFSRTWGFQRGIGVGFDDQIHLGASTKSCLLPVLVDYSILDANLTVEGIGFVDADLRLLRFIGRNGLDNLFYRSGQLLPPLGHWPLSKVVQPRLRL